MSNTRYFEAKIRETVLTAARLRARTQTRSLPDVARAILESASKQATPSDEGVAHPAQRPPEAKQKRIRFALPVDQHAIIKDRIRASGRSMTAVLEHGLESYAETGEF